MKKLKRILILIPIIIILIIVSPFVICPIINDISLNSFSKQLDDLESRQDITFIEKQSICGKLNGNGNGMDYLACLLVKSDLSADELNSLYYNPNFKTAKKGSNSIVDFEVVPITQNKLISKYLEHGEIIFDKLSSVSDYSNYFALVIYDGGYSADFDIRGR